MLEQLGLGIVLSLEDNFTEASNQALDSFNRLQNGAENLVANIQKQMLNMRNVMMTGFTFREMGESVENFGQKVTGMFKGMYSEIEKSGAQWETLKRTLQTFYGDETQSVMKKGLELASKTPFQINDVMDSLRSLKAVRMDALKEYDALDQAGKQYKKTFLEYVGDLGAFNPQQGIEGAMYALRNLLGGNKKSLDQRFDVNSELILGESWSTEPQKVQEQFKTFVEKLAPNMMHNLEGTAEQLISNLEDKWDMFKIELGDQGAFKPMKSTLTWIADKVEELYQDGKFKTFAQAVGSAMASLWKPIDMAIKGITTLAIKIADFTSKHPLIAKIALGFVAVSGAVMTLTGLVMKLSGSFLLALSSISMLILNMQLMKAQGISLFASFSGLGAVIRTIASSLGILALAGAGFYVAWQRDIGGLKTQVTSFYNSVVQGWNNAHKALSDRSFRKALMGNGDDLRLKYNIKMPPLVKMFSQKFAKILAVTKAFWQVFTGSFEDGKMRFSKEDWDLYEDMGIAGLVRGLVYAREKIDNFVKGFTEGLTSVVGVAKEFASVVWTPIKLLIDAVDKYTAEHPGGILASLFVSEDGVDIDTANNTAQAFEAIGRALGTITGVLVGMKIVKTIAPLITSPFRKLYTWLGKVGAKASEVKNTLMGITTGGIIKSLSTKLFGGQITDKGIAVAQHFRDNDRTTRGQHVRRDGRYNVVSRSMVDPTYYNYHLQGRLQNGQELQVRNRSRLGRMLFGETYYARNADGSRERLGRFGGILNMNRDDRNITNRATSQFYDRQVPLDNSVDGARHRVTPGDTIGQLRNLRGYSNPELQTLQQRASLSARSVSRLAGSRFDRFESVRMREMERDFDSLANRQQRGGNLSSREASRLASYRQSMGNYANGLSPEQLRGMSQSEIFRNSMGGANSQAFMNTYGRDLRRSYVNTALQNDSTYQRQLSGIRAQQSGNQAIYADTQQGRLSRALFGQRVYTVSEGANGETSRQVVARRGGLFNRRDMQYNPSSPSLRSRISSSAVGRRVSGAIGGVRTGVSNLYGRANNIYGRGVNALTNNRVSRFVGRGVGAVTGRMRSAGFNVPRMSVPTTIGGAVRGIGRGAVGGVRMAGRGAMALGRGAVRGVSAVGRGIGMVGGLAMRALPIAMVGSMAYKGITNLAERRVRTKEDRQKYGISTKDNKLNQGLKVLQHDMKKLNFGKIWDNFKTQGKTAFKTVVEIGKNLWASLKPYIPKILKESFEGVKACAKLAWNWIKTDGLTMLQNLATSAMSLLGKAWEWIKTEGASKFGELVGKAIVGLVKLGAYIIQHIPEYISQAIELGKTIIQGLWDFAVEVFKGIGSTIKEAVIGAIEGLGSAVSGALGGIIRSVPGIGNDVADFLGLPAHHGGLWMNDEEHMAIIRKDETVLPPDISKELNNNLTGKGAIRNTTNNSSKKGAVVNEGDSITIQKVDVIIQATGGSMTTAEARDNANKILNELKKIKKNKKVRNYQDIDGTESLI